jgi:two-component system sensor histidine kinase ResE
MQIINDLNLKKQAKELGLKIWQTPGFIFLIIGVVAITVMTATFFISRNYDSPEVLVLSETVIAILILSAGNFVVNMVYQMARLNRMKTEFVSIVSHQLRTPLSALKWEAELMLSKFRKGLNKKQLKNVETIEELSSRMIRLVNDLLDVARIDQGRLFLKKEPVDISAIIKKTINESLALAKARNIEVVFTDKKLPKIMTDPERIKLAVENLFSNSIKYTTRGGKIEVKLSKKGSSFVFSIKDNGVGIPEEQHDLVFNKFFRSDNVVKYQTEGTGLGLYIAKNIIEQSGGKIWFQSIENVGTIFSFSLPVK